MNLDILSQLIAIFVTLFLGPVVVILIASRNGNL
uniref:Photosystem II reaction center protein Psb30 n=1 Tax=Oedocladium carolinianum TaxID=55992 RepID=A0A1D8GXA8_9CHLO|nr:hypothetical chloroplast RF12 [Oedocladium carolinianum]AOT84340.1 hypothetical chloroplast RF12 [Oedocladium carolinianum]UCS09733.1 hypothetical chloroplast RF12 [Oedocladium carolinianum]